MKSFYISPKTYVSQELLRTCLLLFITRRLRKYEGLVFPMIPYVNDIRFSNQTPQAFRMMFGVDGENVSDDVVMRSVYGPLAILKTTGFHPSTGFKVFPFSSNKILQLLSCKYALLQFVWMFSVKGSNVPPLYIDILTQFT